MSSYLPDTTRWIAEFAFSEHYSEKDFARHHLSIAITAEDVVVSGAGIVITQPHNMNEWSYDASLKSFIDWLNDVAEKARDTWVHEVIVYHRYVAMTRFEGIKVEYNFLDQPNEVTIQKALR